MPPTQSRLKWQKFAGFILPTLLAWFSFGWIYGVSHWISNLHYFANKEWIVYPIYLGWVVFALLTFNVMGIVSAFCWRHQNWDIVTKKKMMGRFSYFLWCASFPITILLICSCFGWVVIPIQIIAYECGIDRGERWIKAGAIDNFLGRNNEWERDKSE